MAIFKHSSGIHSWVNDPVFRLKSFVNASFTNIQIWERPTYFCASEEQRYCSHTRRPRFRHFMAVGARNSFWIFSWKEKEIWTKKIHHVHWVTIGYLWEKMKVDDFPSMCHIFQISLGRKGNSLLKCLVHMRERSRFLKEKSESAWLFCRLIWKS